MAIDLKQACHMRVKVDGTAAELVESGTVESCFRALLVYLRQPKTRWESRQAAKQILVTISNQPIDRQVPASDKLGQVLAGLNLDYIETDEDQATEVSPFANDPKILRLIQINTVKSVFDESHPHERAVLIEYAQSTYPDWFKTQFLRKYL